MKTHFLALCAIALFGLAQQARSARLILTPDCPAPGQSVLLQAYPDDPHTIFGREPVQILRSGNDLSIYVAASYNGLTVPPQPHPMEATLGPFVAGTYHLAVYQQARQIDGSLGPPVFDTALDFPVLADPPPCTPASIVVEPRFAVAAPGAAFPIITARVLNSEGRPLSGIPLYWVRRPAPGEPYDDPRPEAHFDATQAQTDGAGEVKIAATANAVSGAANHDIVYWGRNLVSAYFVLANNNASGEIVPIVEYQSASDIDHYFLTAEASEIAALDRGLMGAWYPTGAVFLAWPEPVAGAGFADVCRFYGSMSPGPNSHFYTASEAECAMLIAQSSATPPDRARWNYEGRAFAAKLPAGGGVCSGDAPTPLYRLYNDGFARRQAPHHRYTISPAVYAQMQELGWKAEGIAMCLR